jgi:EAL domain-containing protein (putative c-di-GMP-specific phosphodiesterase class I)
MRDLKRIGDSLMRHQQDAAQRLEGLMQQSVRRVFDDADAAYSNRKTRCSLSFDRLAIDR